jgi:hypothetical protein
LLEFSDGCFVTRRVEDSFNTEPDFVDDRLLFFARRWVRLFLLRLTEWIFLKGPLFELLVEFFLDQLTALLIRLSCLLVLSALAFVGQNFVGFFYPWDFI